MGHILYFGFVAAKPENLILDASGNLKDSDFGLNALSQQVKVTMLLNFEHLKPYSLFCINSSFILQCVFVVLLFFYHVK